MGDISTWSFVRKDGFGNDIQYVYSANAENKLQLVTTNSSCQEKLQDSYNMYKLDSEVYIEMAYRAVVATCTGE